MKFAVALVTVLLAGVSVNAHASLGLRSLNWFWLPGPPVVEKMSAETVVIAGHFDDLAAERMSLGCASEILCAPPTVGATAAPCRIDITACLPKSLRSDLGASYAQPGPNCFSTALKASGLTEDLAGVDAPEMKAFARAFCTPVEPPRSLDVGIYFAPGADPFADSTLWVHAFTFLSPAFVLEKQGVDYWGPTPVTLRGFSIMDYRVRISPECRRFATDTAVCANQLLYLRCRMPELPDDLETKLGKMATVTASLLQVERVTPADFALWDQAFDDLRNTANRVSVNAATKNYVREKLASLRKQRQFFR